MRARVFQAPQNVYDLVASVTEGRTVMRKALGVVLAAAAFSAVGLAQQSTPITLDVVVTPKHGGTAVAGLTAQDFTVLDNGKPQKITSFEAQGGSTAPVEIILVIDAVDTYYTAISFERAQIDAFLHANDGHLQYPTMVAVFNDRGTEVQNGFSRDGNIVAKLLDNYTVALRSITRSGGIYGAGERLGLAMKAMGQFTAYSANLPGRKLLIWMSPGWPLLSSAAIEISGKQQDEIFRQVIGLSTELRRAQVTVYSIDPLGMNDAGGVNTFYYRNFLNAVKRPRDTQFGDLGLQVLATQTGGQVLNTNNNLTQQLKNVLADTDAYYHLTIEPTPGEPDEYHKLEVKVSKPGVVARTRTGYYSR